ncbi:TPA: cysteine methyltransferase [Candidatus Falkowbacteria bacterium]|nr:cysteine methyltransferase [Candidatus Falkowbacteria bacterium]
MSDFQKQVLDMVKEIPAGRVLTYSRIAEKIGRPAAARAVGNALNKNQADFLSQSFVKIPCHRVVRADGSIGGFRHSQKHKIALLELEGVKVVNNRIDLRQYGGEI